MNIPKAIELLEGSKLSTSDPQLRDLNDAIRMGVGALIRIMNDRKGLFFPPKHLLPGETED